MVLARTQSQQEIVETARLLAPSFAERAAEHDRELLPV